MSRTQTPLDTSQAHAPKATREIESNSERALAIIRVQLASARQHLADVQDEMQALASLGLWPAASTEQWQNRNGSGQYLYIIFHQDPAHAGKFLGPNGKRKIYIGNSKLGIAAARRKAKNRAQYDALEKHARALAAWIQETEHEVENLARRAKMWPRTKLSGFRQLALPQSETSKGEKDD